MPSVAVYFPLPTPSLIMSFKLNHIDFPLHDDYTEAFLLPESTTAESYLYIVLYSTQVLHLAVFAILTYLSILLCVYCYTLFLNYIFSSCL